MSAAFAISPIILEYLVGAIAMNTGTVESHVRVFRLLIAYPVVCGLVLLLSMTLSRKLLGWHNLMFALTAACISFLNLVRHPA